MNELQSVLFSKKLNWLNSRTLQLVSSIPVNVEKLAEGHHHFFQRVGPHWRSTSVQYLVNTWYRVNTIQVIM